MSDLALPTISSTNTLAQVVSTLGTWRTNIRSKINDGLTGGASGSGNNFQEDSVYRVNVRDETRANTLIGEIFQADSEIRASGGVVAKSSGLVYTTSDGTWYVLDTGADPDQTIRVRKTGISNDSVAANQDTYFDVGADAVIDKNAVANGATAPTVAANHTRFAKVVSSAEIATVTMLGNTTYRNTNWATKHGMDTVRLVAPNASASAAISVTLKAGTRVRSRTDDMNISVGADIICTITTAGKNGLDTGAESASTWYALHLIGDSTNSNTPALILSKSSTVPTFPTGYDKSRRIGWRRNNGASHLLQGTNWGREARYRRQQNALTGGSSTTYTDVSFASMIPSTATLAKISLRMDDNNISVGLRTNGVTAASDEYVIESQPGTNLPEYNFLDIETDTGQIIEYKVAGGANRNVGIDVVGYVDEV